MQILKLRGVLQPWRGLEEGYQRFGGARKTTGRTSRLFFLRGSASGPSRASLPARQHPRRSLALWEGSGSYISQLPGRSPGSGVSLSHSHQSLEQTPGPPACPWETPPSLFCYLLALILIISLSPQTPHALSKSLGHGKALV